MLSEEETKLFYSDYHVHSAFSDDSVYEIEEVVRDAVDLGIEELCFTEHVDYGVKRDWDDPRGVLYRKGKPGDPDAVVLANADYPVYVHEVERLREQYKDRITVKLGLEFGMQKHTIPEFEKLFARYPFDFIILSVHQVDDTEFWTGDLQKTCSTREFFFRYYEEILYLVEHYQNYSILGHLDSCVRYADAAQVPFKEVKPIIEQILKRVIADGKGIEVNTSFYRYNVPYTPSVEILEMYRDLGGEILTIGSDSHRKDHLGYKIPETMRELRDMGFRKFCTYEQMKPIFHEL